MKRKSKSGKKRITLLLLITLIVILLAVPPAITYAQGLLQFVASVSVQPYYKVQAKGNNLYIKTNMALFVNNKKMTYNR